MSTIVEATVFYDDAGEASARVFAVASIVVDGRVLSVDELKECKFVCAVEGPKCRYSTTLTSRISLKHRGVTTWGGLPALVAEAFVPDPCPWSPELPFLYRVVGSVQLGDRTLGLVDQTFGIRPLSAVRRRLVLNGKTWVPRAVNRDIVQPAASLEEWRASAVVMSVVEPDDALCREAGEVGVVLIAGVRSSGGRDAVATVRRLSRYPAVAVALIESVMPLESEYRSAARNTLLACWQPNLPPTDQADATDVFLATKYSFTRLDGVPTLWESERPVFAFSPLQNPHTLDEARSRCDELQADLAGKCHPAGYVV